MPRAAPAVCLAFGVLLLGPTAAPAQRVDRIEKAQVAFSPRGDAVQAILQELKSARARVDVGIYYLTNQTLVDALCALASRQIKVRVFVDQDIAQAAHRKTLDKLAHFGVRVFVENLPRNGKLHLKTAVIDEQTVITGSANWTESSFGANCEDTLLLRSAPLARLYLGTYDWLETQSDLYQAISYSGPPSVSFPSAARMSRDDRQSRLVAPKIAGFFDLREIEVFFSPQQSGVERFIASLRGARRSLDIGIYMVTHPRIVAALAEAARRIPVRLLADGNMNAGGRLAILQQLWDAGVKIHYLSEPNALQHMKVAVVDGQEVWTGSANWTEGAAEVNCEDMLRLPSAQMARHYREYLEYILSQAQSFAAIERSAVAQSAPATQAEALPPRGTSPAAAALAPTGPRRNFRNLDEMQHTPPFRVNGAVRYLSDAQYLPVLLDLIRTARQSILVSMFHVAQGERSTQVNLVIEELAAAAERGLYVYVVLEMPADAGDGQQAAHSRVAETLRARGVDVRLSVPTLKLHEKLVVVDLCKVLIGSHNWSEGALTGTTVYESSALLLLNRQEARFAQHILRHNILSDMRSREAWEKELSLLRHIVSLRGEEREAFLRQLEAGR